MLWFRRRRRPVLMVNALDSGARGLGLGLTWPGHCVAFLGMTLYSHGTFRHPLRLV